MAQLVAHLHGMQGGQGFESPPQLHFGRKTPRSLSGVFLLSTSRSLELLRRTREFGAADELDALEGLIAHYMGVVTRWDGVGVAG